MRKIKSFFYFFNFYRFVSAINAVFYADADLVFFFTVMTVTTITADTTIIATGIAHLVPVDTGEGAPAPPNSFSIIGAKDAKLVDRMFMASVAVYSLPFSRPVRSGRLPNGHTYVTLPSCDIRAHQRKRRLGNCLPFL